MQKDFPKKKEVAKPNVLQKPKVRAFQMTLEAAKDEADVSSGTFLVNDLADNILFDSGAKYYFISHRFGRRLAFPIDILYNALIFELTSGICLPISDCIRNIDIDLNRNKLYVELFPIELNGSTLY